MKIETSVVKKEINTELEKCLDEQFPKGDKARGRALVLFATAQMQIDKQFQEGRAEQVKDELIFLEKRREERRNKLDQVGLIEIEKRIKQFKLLSGEKE